MMNATTISNVLIPGGLALATAGIVIAATRYVHHEILRRGYPAWADCQCDFKHRETIFQVWHNQHERRGETVISREWGLYLHRPAQWLRYFLHYSAQTLAILNPRGRFLERTMLSPQESFQFAASLYGGSSSDDATEANEQTQAYIAWRSEVLHFPRYLFDECTRRLYPVHVSRERLAQTRPLPVVWDSISDLPIPLDGSAILATPTGTRIDCIGWAPAQISYCTARLTPASS